jgi:hypothetical protein
MSRRTVAFWILFAITAALYIVMIAWSLPEVSKAAGGLAPFDIRPHGYSFEEAKAFVAALSPDGKAFYLDVQERLDLFYPALLSATLFFAIYLLVPAGWGAWRWVLALAAIPSAVFDYLENHAVAAMLGLGADALTPDIVATADRWTELKGAFSALAMVIVLILLLIWAWTRVAAWRGSRA